MASYFALKVVGGREGERVGGREKGMSGISEGRREGKEGGVGKTQLAGGS
jgi:hypothetical protein